MTIDQERWPKFWESSSVVKTVGIPQIHLNKLIERKQHGIRASISAGRGRGSRRFFSEDDVRGVALVWWLFEGGLRSATIQFVLNQVCNHHRDSTANDAAQILVKRGMEMLVVKREPRTTTEGNRDHAAQQVFLVQRSDALQLVEGAKTEVLLVISARSLFADLKKSLQKLDASMQMPRDIDK